MCFLPGTSLAIVISPILPLLLNFPLLRPFFAAHIVLIVSTTAAVTTTIEAVPTFMLKYQVNPNEIKAHYITLSFIIEYFLQYLFVNLPLRLH